MSEFQLKAKQAGLFVVIPAFNEATAIGEVIDAVSPLCERVIVVDDCSSDESGSIALDKGADVLTHRINLGQGAALQTGISYALREGARFIGTFDADGQHEPDDLICMLNEIRRTGADVALGSRFLGTAPGMTSARRLTLMAATVFTRLITGLQVSDTHNGIRLFTRAAAARVQISQNWMAHASELLTGIAEAKLHFVEVPVKIHYTAYSMQKGQKLTGAFVILTDLLSGKLLK